MSDEVARSCSEAGWKPQKLETAQSWSDNTLRLGSGILEGHCAVEGLRASGPNHGRLNAIPSESEVEWILRLMVRNWHFASVTAKPVARKRTTFPKGNALQGDDPNQ